MHPYRANCLHYAIRNYIDLVRLHKVVVHIVGLLDIGSAFFAVYELIFSMPYQIMFGGLEVALRLFVFF